MLILSFTFTFIRFPHRETANSMISQVWWRLGQQWEPNPRSLAPHSDARATESPEPEVHPSPNSKHAFTGNRTRIARSAARRSTHIATALPAGTGSAPDLEHGLSVGEEAALALVLRLGRPLLLALERLPLEPVDRLQYALKRVSETRAGST